MSLELTTVNEIKEVGDNDDEIRDCGRLIQETRGIS